VNRLDLFEDPYRIVCCTESGEVLFDCPLFAECKYERPSTQFHQWTAEDGAAFGLSFATEEEAAAFAAEVEDAIQDLNIVAGLTKNTAGTPSTNAQGTPRSKPWTTPEATPGDLQSLQSIRELPAPKQFAPLRSYLQPADAAWTQLETLLRFAHATDLNCNVELNAAAELVDADALAAFEEAYEDFGVVDLWLNVADDHVQNVIDGGLQSLGQQTLSCGVPLGMFVGGGDMQRFILCKVALGRSLPTTVESLTSCPDAPLPVGYHSLCVIPDGDIPEDAASQLGISMARFKHNYIVPNTSLVLPSHVVEFTVEETSNTDADMFDTMSLLQVRPEILDDTYKEQIMSVCDPNVLQQDNLALAVDQSYQALWSELEALSTGLCDLNDTLESSCGSVESFQEESLRKADEIRNNMVAYLDHSMQVTQYIKDSQFEMKRALSDSQRLQELHLHLHETMTKGQFVMCWSQLSTMRDTLQHEINIIAQQPSLHEQTMALTEQNKRIVGLRRKAMLRDGLIQRLAEHLQMRGALKPEDEALIVGF